METTPEEASSDVTAFSIGVGGLLGFGGSISPAKLAFARGLTDRPDAAGTAAGEDGTSGLLEMRVHGVGGSSPEEILEQADWVQVGGDGIAQFIRRWGGQLRIVPWPLEGYWWGGLTSRPATRALWSLMFPLLLSNLAAWMAPAPPRPAKSGGWMLWLAGSCLAVTLRWAGYVLTLVFTASVASASLDTFGWQCTGHPAASGACHVSWLNWTPGGLGPRMTLSALVPVLVVALVGFASWRTASSYERWQIGPAVQAAPPATQAWPLAAKGFWHGQRPVTRLQLLHLAGAAGLISLYLAWVQASHQGWRITAICAAFAVIAVAGLTLAWPHTGRPGSNPYPRPGRLPQAASDERLGFDLVARGVLVVAAALLTALILARLWWRPVGPPAKGFPGVLPGDAGIWEALGIAMGVLVAAAFLLTLVLKIVIASATRQAEPAAAGTTPRAPLRPFAGGFLGPATLCLACLTGGILAAGVNLAIPRLLIGSAFQVGPAYPDRVSDIYPVELPWPLFGFMSGLVAMLAAVIALALCYALPRFLLVARANMGKLPRYYPDGKDAAKSQLRRVAQQWSESRAADLMGLLAVVLALAGLGGIITFSVVNPNRSVVEGFIGFQQWLVGAAAVALYGYTVSAFRNQAKRTQIQALWDVGTFWPRACQPFAPPCYMERSVPELVNRLNSLLTPGQGEGNAARIARELTTRLGPNLNQERLAADLRELTPHYDRILVNGYSQGACISAAAIAQLPAERISKLALVTVGSPLRRLYGRGFPIYFAPDCLDDLRALLGGGEQVRWRNAVRKSDYIGGFVFADPYGDELLEHFVVDKAVLDPVCVIPGDGDNATVPVIHGHSDFWPDPQVALMTASLLAPISPQPAATADAPDPAPVSMGIESGRDALLEGPDVVTRDALMSDPWGGPLQASDED
jgi:hypothetical protein